MLREARPARAPGAANGGSVRDRDGRQKVDRSRTLTTRKRGRKPWRASRRSTSGSSTARSRSGSVTPVRRESPGRSGAPTSASASGVRFARTPARTATPGTAVSVRATKRAGRGSSRGSSTSSVARAPRTHWRLRRRGSTPGSSGSRSPGTRQGAMSSPRYPALYQVNTRIRLSELGAQLRRPASLDDIPDAEIDGWAADGFDLVWLLGVWQTCEAARAVSRSNPQWLAEYRLVLPDFREEDVCGSCFAIRDYQVHEDFGGDEALARLRWRMKRRGLRLILDFVPNHMAPDHPWATEHPEFFVSGTEEQLRAEPQNYCRRNGRVLAYGRDPYFDGWPDTLQLDYGNPALQEAMLAELGRIARQCDGVRCDMAMLVLPEVFVKTWGIPSAPFWPKATAAVRAKVPGFVFMAEVYWDLEWTLQQQGFDFTYDKRLYDRLEQRRGRAVREHLFAD